MGARVIKIERPGAGDFARGYDERVRGLSSHFVWTNRSKDVYKRQAQAMVAAGAEPKPGSAEAFGVFVRGEVVKWREVIAKAGIKVE